LDKVRNNQMKRAALKMAVAPAAPSRFLSVIDFGPAQL